MRRSDQRLFNDAAQSLAVVAERTRIRRQLRATWFALALAVLILSGQVLLAVVKRDERLDALERQTLICTPIHAGPSEAFACRPRAIR